MPFNSLQFAVFFIAVFILYRFLDHKRQNFLLLIASCIFYAAWDGRFLVLVFVSITTDYLCALKMHGAAKEPEKKFFLFVSLFVNLSILGFFKYFDFFSQNFVTLADKFGLAPHPVFVSAALPLGISFYTFRTLSYTFDVYTEKISPTKNFWNYSLFVLFFPMLSAGPIMKAADFLPQIVSPRKFRLEGFYEGCYWIYWGFFQKILGDHLQTILPKVLAGYLHENSGVGILFANYTLALQIYCDFAGYSNIAKGLGKCLGFDIMTNFNLPYFSTNPQDFWNRWHISLSLWLREYVYTPLAFGWKQLGKWGITAVIMVTFILCGLWHGATWNYVLWGAYWGILLVLYLWLKPALAKMREPEGAFAKNAWFAVRVIFFFHVVCLGWLIFTSTNLQDIINAFSNLIFNFMGGRPASPRTFWIWIRAFAILFYAVWLLLLIEGVQFKRGDLLAVLKWPVWARATVYFLIYYAFVSYGVEGGKQFIYFQF